MNSLELGRVQQLTEKQLAIYNAELQRQSRSVGIAYLLYFFLGCLGVHKFYLGKIGWGITYILLGTLGTILTFLGIGFLPLSIIGGLMLFVFGIFLLIDLFTIPRQIRKREEKIKEDLLSQFERGE